MTARRPGSVAGRAATGRDLVRRWRATAPAAGVGPEPVSSAQRGVLAFERLHPGTGAYALSHAVLHEGPLDEDRFQRAFARLQHRHPALRTTFADRPSGPVRTPGAAPVSAWKWADLDDLDAGDPVATAVRRAADLAAQPFDLEAGPLVRGLGMRLGPDRWVLAFAVHHLVCDGASADVLLAELAALYATDAGTEARPPVDAPGPAPAAAGYWAARLAGLEPLGFPRDRPAPPRPTFAAGSVPVVVSSEVVAAAERLGRAESTGVFPVLVAAVQLLLAQQTGQRDVAIGTPEAGRSGPGGATAVGLLADLVVLRTEVDDRLTPRELVRRVRDTCHEALEHRGIPVAALPSTTGRGEPPVEVVLGYRGRRPTTRLAGSPVRVLDVPRTALAPTLELQVWLDDDGLHGSLDHRVELVDAAAARRTADRLPHLLAVLTADPDTPLRALDLLTAADHDAVRRWRAGPKDDAPFVAVTDLVAQVAAGAPHAVAVRDASRDLTYGELVRRARLLTDTLRSRGVGRGDVVALGLPRDVDLLVGILGILGSGAAYLPLDPTYPSARTELMRTDGNAVAEVTSETLACLGPERPPGPAGAAPSTPRAGDPAYVLYTSGSTGRPKAVVVTHGSVAALMRWGISAFPPEHLARVLASTSVCFDVSVFELLVPLCAGGTVVVVEDVTALADRPADVTLVSTVPSAARTLVAVGALPRSTRAVVLAGEALTSALVDDLYRVGHVEEVHNLYGPTEDTTFSTGGRALAGKDAVPIGAPLPGERAHVLDAALRPTPVGAVGELYLAGSGLAAGYHRRPGLTASRFVANPYDGPGTRMYRTGDLVRRRGDGALLYLGRSDTQVKVRGHRVELGEVESVLERARDVRDCAVVLHDGRLVAHLTGGPGLDPDRVRAHARTLLPDVMVPAAVVVHERLPTTPNGKVDRGALARWLPEASDAEDGAVLEPGPASADDVRAASPDRRAALLEAYLRAVLLPLVGDDVRTAGRRTPLLEVGLDSLSAVQLRHRVDAELGLDLRLAPLLAGSSLADLAAELAPQVTNETGDRAAVPDPVPCEESLSPSQRWVWVVQQMEPTTDQYTFAVALRLPDGVVEAALRTAVEALVARHAMLRTTFRLRGRDPVQVVDARGARAYAEHDATGEADEVLLGRLATLATRPFDLSHGPLVRFDLVRHDDAPVLLVSAHHIASDFWSTSLLAQELGELYRAAREGEEPDLPPVRASFLDVVRWQRDLLSDPTRLGALEEYWQEEVGDTWPALTLPAPRGPARGGERRFAVPTPLAQRLRTRARDERTTVYVLLLTAFQVLLHARTGADDVAVGSSAVARPRPEFAQVVGCCTNPVVLRSTVRPHETLRSMLARSRDRVLGALEHQDYPMIRLVQRTRQQRRGRPLFDALFTYNQAPRRGDDVVAAAIVGPAGERRVLGGLRVENLPLPHRSGGVAVELMVAELDGVPHGLLTWRAGALDDVGASGFVEDYLTVLGALADAPELSLDDVLGPVAARSRSPALPAFGDSGGRVGRG